MARGEGAGVEDVHLAPNLDCGGRSVWVERLDVVWEGPGLESGCSAGRCGQIKPGHWIWDLGCVWRVQNGPAESLDSGEGVQGGCRDWMFSLLFPIAQNHRPRGSNAAVG